MALPVVNSSSQLIFFFSALGAFNGLLLALYFGLTARRRKFSNYFLALLLMVLSIRIIKSVFFYFNPYLANIFIQIGLCACVLIGPFLYLYLRSYGQQLRSSWIWHIVPSLLFVTLLGVLFPYVEHRALWSRWIVKGIYLQWFAYLILSFGLIKHSLQDLIKRRRKPLNIDIWLFSVFSGVGLIWLAYCIASYTSYIVGALSFSFVLYLFVLLLVLRKDQDSAFLDEKQKYKNKEIPTPLLELIQRRLPTVKDRKLYLDPGLTLAKVANELNIPPHSLSQFLNENMGRSFSAYINELRIEKAKELLDTNQLYTIESLGHESGFNSRSSFFATFKKLTGQTPDDYRKRK